MSESNIKRKIAWRMKRWMPKSKLAKFTLYVVFLRLIVFVIDQALKLAANGGGTGEWSGLLNFILGICVIVLGLRWFRQQFLWKVRNKMILTYLFIGLVPVLLVLLMAFIAGYLFLNQYATSQARSEIEEEVKRLEVVNAGAALELEELTAKGVPVNEKMGAEMASVRHHDQRFPGWQLVYWQNGKPLLLHGGGTMAHEAEEPEWSKGEYQGIVVDEGKLFLRAAVPVQNKNTKGHLVSSVPITGKMLDHLANDIGVIQIFLPRLDDNGGNKSTALQISIDEGDIKSNASGKKSYVVNNSPDVAGGSLPPLAQGTHAFDMNFTSAYPYKDLSSKQKSFAVLQLHSRPDILVNRLFANTGVFASMILSALAVTAAFFGIIVLLASFFGFGLMRTITYAVYNLYEGTQHVNRGNFKHRIAIKSKDQLAALQTSFNQMSESIERLILEQKEKERLENELAIAQEVQATLFPRSQQKMEFLELHGVCKPARTVSGDYYDFLPCGGDRLGITLGDISGKGISAALLMATIHSAVRAYEYGNMPDRRELVSASAAAIAGAAILTETSRNGNELLTESSLESPARVMELLNRHVFNSTPAEKYATLFLAIYDGAEQSLTYCNAGHLPPLLVGNDGNVRKLDVNGMVVGLFDGIAWDESSIHLEPGDIFVAFSDGVTEPENEFGEFGEERLIEVIRENRHLPLDRISESVITAVMDWIGANEQPDDVTLVLARQK